MRSLLCLSLLSVFAGCQTCAVLPNAHNGLDATLSAANPAVPEVMLCAAAATPPLEKADLASLWSLALANNPELREAAAEIDAAQGHLIQACKYPNPHFVYSQENLGNGEAPPGGLKFEVNQEIVTSGKRRLEIAIATRGIDMAHFALATRKFEVLARVRRLYYDYLNWQYTLTVNREVVATLEQGVSITRIQVEQAQTRPRTDLLRLEALLREARIALASNQANLEASWKQLTAELGVPNLSLPAKPPEWASPIPDWESEAVTQRVESGHSAIKRVAMEAERARLELDRARAEVVPNVTVGGGFSKDYVDRVQGASLSAETALPIWDRKQGLIHEAEAKFARAQAAQQSVAHRLTRDTAEAFGRYQAARQQVEQLSKEVLPVWVESLEALRKAYQAGSTQITFADVLQAHVSLNETKLKIAEARRVLWQAIADLQGFMQMEVAEMP